MAAVVRHNTLSLQLFHQIMPLLQWSSLPQVHATGCSPSGLVCSSMATPWVARPSAPPWGPCGDNLQFLLGACSCVDSCMGLWHCGLIVWQSSNSQRTLSPQNMWSSPCISVVHWHMQFCVALAFSALGIVSGHCIRRLIVTSQRCALGQVG